MDIKQIRKQYPEYDGIDDQQLAEGLHKKYYPELDFKDFSSRIGYAQGPEATVGRVAGRLGRTVASYPANVAASVRNVFESTTPEEMARSQYSIPGGGSFPPDNVKNSLTMLDSAFDQMTHVEKARICSVALGYEADGEKWEAAKRRATTEHIKKQREEFIPTLKKVEEVFGLPEKYQESSGLAEDIAGGIGTSLTSIPAYMLSPILGAVGTAGQIKGAKVQELERQGVTDPKLINMASGLSAAIQTPLESVSDLFVLSRILKPAGKWTGHVVNVAQSMVGEGATEYAQQYPDEFATMMALNPDIDTTTLIGSFIDRIGEIHENATYSGLVGALSSGVTTAAGKGAMVGVNKFITSEQKAVTQTKIDKLTNLIEKHESSELSEPEVQELRELAGMPEKDAATIVEDIKKRIEIQAPIQSAERDSVAEAIQARLADDTLVADEMALYDGIARSWAERNDRNPAEFYKDVLGGVEAADDVAPEGGVLKQAPVDETTTKMVEQFNIDNPGNALKYDGEMDLSAIGRPNMYQFTAYDGPAKGDTFMTSSLDPAEINTKLSEKVDMRIGGEIDSGLVKKENGDPLVLYHGSYESNLDQIDVGVEEPGAWLTTSYKNAGSYTGMSGRVYRVNIKSKNPLVVDFTEDQEPVVDGEIINLNSEGRFRFDDFRDNVSIAEYADRNNYDGVHFPLGNYTEEDETWVVFSASQIKIIRDTLEQSDRGEINKILESGPSFIKLFEAADASTPIHEIGHLSLKLLAEEQSEDYNTIAQWLGVDQDRAASGLKAWTTYELESFARGFEAYVMEGTAPTHKLQAAFQRMKQLLVDIYKSVKALKVELNDDVRGVFDRLVASDIERNENPLIDISEWFNVDKHDTKINLATASFEDIESVGKARVMAEVSRARKAEAKNVRAQIKKDATAEIESYPFYKMVGSLKSDKMDLSDIKNDYDDATVEIVKTVLRGGTKLDGRTPWAVMAENGYNDIDAFVGDIISAPPKAEAIESLEASLFAEYERGLIAENAKIYSDVISEQVSLLEQALGKTKKSSIKQRVRKSTGQINDAEYKQLVDDMKKDSMVAKEAFFAGKKEEALKAKIKQRERVAQIYDNYKERQERQKIDRRMKRLWKANNIPGEYRAQIVGFLREYYNIPDSYIVPQEINMEGFLASKFESNEWVVDSIRGELENVPPQDRNKQGYRVPLALDDKQRVARIADMLAHMGKTESAIIGEGKKQDFEATLSEMVGRGYDTFKINPSDPLATPPSARRLNWYQAMSKGGKEYLSQLRKAEFILQALDGWEFDGPNWQIFQDIKKAEDAELNLGDRVFKEVQNAFTDRGFDRKWALKKYAVPGRQEMWTKEELVMVALNAGNDGNRTALREGFNLDDATIDHITENLLDDTERGLVGDIWDTLESLYPHADKVNRALTGVPLPRVEGKYFPLKFDRDLSWRASAFADRDKNRDLFASAYTRPSVQAGHRKARVGGKMAPHLSFSVIQKHLVEVVHDATHQIPVRNGQKFLSNPQYRGMVSDTMGDDVYRQLTPWLSDVAKPMREPATKIDKWVSRIRKNATVVGLGFKVTVAQKQMLSLTQTVDELGLKPTLKAMAHFYAHPQSTAQFIKESSTMIRNRRRQWDRDLAQFSQSFDPKNFKGEEQVRDAFFAMIGFMDSVATYPTWLAGYNVGMERFNNDHDKSVEFADQTVRRTQPVASPKDLSTIQRGGETRSEIRKIFTMFYTFFSIFQNRMQETNLKHKLGETNTIGAMKSYMWIMIIPALTAAVIQKRRLPEGAEWFKEIAGYWLAAFPFLRDVFNPILSGFDYTMTPVESGLESVSKLARVLQANEVKPRAVVKEAVKVAGYAYGLPSSQMNITMDGIIDLMSGDTNNPARLLFRKPYDEKKRSLK